MNKNRNMKVMLPEPIYFVSGIDTDAGKTIATGFISRSLLDEGVGVITQKLIQTGNTGMSEDITKHREIEGRPYTREDLKGVTCPLIYTYPCSPHMAIAIDQRSDEIQKATEATTILSQRYEKILLEGAGGLMVPLTEERLTIDYIQQQRLPVILVTTAKLGSINHTLLSIEALKTRQIEIAMIVYNTYIQTSQEITVETERYLRQYLSVHAPQAHFVTLPEISVHPQ